MVFTPEAVVDETFSREPTNIRNSTVGIHASQVYPYSMCPPIPTVLYTRRGLDSETSRLTLRQNKTRSFENMVKSHFQRTKPKCKTEGSFTTSRQKKNDSNSVDGFFSHCSFVFEAMACSYHLCPRQEVPASLTEVDVHCSTW